MKLEVFDGVALGTQGDAMLTLWKSGSRAHRLNWMFEFSEKFIVTQPSFVIMQVILPSSEPPDGDARKAISRQLEKLRPHMRRLVTVPIGDSFRISIVRSVMRAVALLSGLSGVQVIAADEEIGIRKLLEAASKDTPSAAELKQSMRALHDALAPVP